MTYYDSNSSPRACFADGIAIATYASVGQRALTVAPEKALASMAAVIMIRVTAPRLQIHDPYVFVAQARRDEQDPRSARPLWRGDGRLVPGRSYSIDPTQVHNVACGTEQTLIRLSLMAFTEGSCARQCPELNLF